MSALPDKQAAWAPTGITLEPAALTVAKSETNHLVVAGPGAGKTEMLAQRACFLLQTGTCPPPFRILAISFKREAAENLKARVILRCGRELASRLDSYTFDAFAKDLLDRFRLALPVELRPSPDYRIITGRDAGDDALRVRMLELSLDHLTLSTFQRQQVRGNELRLGMIGRRLPPGDWPTSAHFLAGAGMWRALIADDPSQLTFPMINRLAEFIVRSNPLLLTALRDTYRFVFLDEFQDTTSLQCELMETCFLGSSAVVTGVGDTKQRIMGWAGALPGVFERFRKNFGAEIAHLTQNHRSRSLLVEIQAVFAAELDPGAAKAVSVRTGPETGECHVLEFASEDTEAAHLATMIRECLDEGVAPEEICVLCRAQPDKFASALIARLKADGIQVKVEVNRRETLGEPVVALLLDMIALAFSESAPGAWENVSAIASDALGDKTEEQVMATKRRLLAFVAEAKSKFDSSDGTSAQLRPILEELLGFVGRDRFASVHPQYAQGDYLDELLSRVADLLEEDLPGSGWTGVVDAVKGIGAISVMTMHKSKGLEFDTVLFLGLEDGAIWNYQKNAEEETCGLFVALSRAKERCYFTYCRSRTNKWGNQVAQSRITIKRVFELFEASGVRVEKID